MSSSAVESVSNDKGPNIFQQSPDDLTANFFDQFLTFDPIDNEGPHYPTLPDSTHLAKSTRDSNITDTSSKLRGGEGKESTSQEPRWNWAFSQRPASSSHTSAPGSHFYSELSGRAAISDSELLSLENITFDSPISPISPISPLSPTIRASSLPSRPSTPTPTTTTIARKKARITSIPKILKKAIDFDKSLRGPIRKTRTSPKMVRGSEAFQNSLDIWGEKSNSKFQFDFEHPLDALSPSTSAQVSDASDASSSTRFSRESHDDVFSFSNSLPHQLNGRRTENHTPLATPLLGGQHSRKTSPQQPFSEGMGFPPTPQFYQDSGTWTQIPGSSEFTAHATSAIHTPETEAPMWWNHAATAPMAQPSPTALHINPLQATKSLVNQLQNDTLYELNGISSNVKIPSGLMIRLAESPAQQSFVVQSPQMHSPHVAQSILTHTQPANRHQYPLPPCPYIPNASPQQLTHSRKTRIAATKHSESPSPKRASSAVHVRKRRATRASKNGQRAPSSSTVDFVNFTPNDSWKILTGVAPSGSSKTKARREKEAMEKRRQLSVAALRAVRAAGGDVESLVEQGLFI